MTTDQPINLFVYPDDEHDLDHWPASEEFHATVFAPYEALDLTIQRYPQRSEFYFLEPYGIGTFEGESLTGFLTRLATNHRVSSGKFIHKGIAITRSSSIDSLWRMNGEMPFWANRMLEISTQRNDLSKMTLAGWQHSPNGNIETDLRKWKAWCPSCYHLDEIDGRQFYERLYWALKSTTACVKHGVPLIETCLNCGKGVPMITNYSRPAHCSTCNQWLGKNPDKALLRIELDEMRRVHPGQDPEEYATQMRVSARFLKRTFPHLYASLDRRYWHQRIGSLSRISDAERTQQKGANNAATIHLSGSLEGTGNNSSIKGENNDRVTHEALH